MKTVPKLIFLLLCVVSVSCKDDDPISLKSVLTSGTWKFTGATLSPGVRIVNSATAPFQTNLFTMDEGEGMDSIEITFKEDGTAIFDNGDGYPEEEEWNVSSDQKNIQLAGSSLSVESFDHNTLVLSMHNIPLWDAYVKNEVPQSVKYTLKKF